MLSDSRFATGRSHRKQIWLMQLSAGSEEAGSADLVPRSGPHMTLS